MRLEFTLGEVSEHGNWEKFCGKTGLSAWCMNEGTADRDDKVTLSVEEAGSVGLMVFVKGRVEEYLNGVG